MLTTAAIVFALSAVFGLILLVMHRQGRPLPLGLALVHGILAAIGLVLLVVAAIGAGLAGLARNSLYLFVIAALGGFVLFAYHLRGQKHPTALILAHGALAVIAFVLLLLALAGF